MAPLDVVGLPPISAEAPAGDNLELDPQFGELERAAQGKPEVQYGSTIEPAVPPDWKETVSLAEALIQRTHDLRILVHLAIARLNLTGIVGYADAVRLIRRLLEDEWAQVHPQLDPEDDNDPMQRSNAVLRLQDPGRVLRALREAPLASTARTGTVAWRDIAVLNGTVEPEPGYEKMTEAAILAAFAGTDQGQLAALREAVDNLAEDVPAISAAFDKLAGLGTGPDYENLVKIVGDIQRELRRFAAVAPAAPDEAGEVAAEEPGAGPAAPRAIRGSASITAITSLSKRDEALHALDLAIAYFRLLEPSSPAPLLLDRAKRLATMEFLDILRDLAPDGLRQAESIAGKTEQ